MLNLPCILCIHVIFANELIRSTIGGNSCGIVNTQNLRRKKGFVVGDTYPWFVSLVQYPNAFKSLSNSFCLGSLISAKDVLTAAHCITSDKPIDVAFDINKLCYRDQLLSHTLRVAKVHMHPQYNSKKPWYDFAVLQLPRNVNTMPICLPSSNDLLPKYGTAVVLNRTGCNQDNLVMPIFKQLECNRMLLRNTYFFEQNVRGIDAGFCAGYLSGAVDTCQGDSGGPFQAPTMKTHIYTVIGVTSFGFGCKQQNTLGVYADVREVVWWIRKVASAKTFTRGQ